MIQRTFLALGLVVCAAAPAAGQVLGLPVVHNGAVTGVAVGADIGFTNAEGGNDAAIGAHLSVGLGFVGVSAMVSFVAPESGKDIVSPGASAALRLFGGPLIPFRVTMQAGAAHWTIDGTQFTHIPLSIGLSATIPNPVVAFKPWIAPRIDILHNNVSGNDINFGISGGIDVALLSGFTVRAAYDRVNNSAAHPSIFSLGLGFAP